MSLQYGFDRHSHYGFGIGCGPSRNSYNFDYFDDYYNDNDDNWDSDDEDGISFNHGKYYNNYNNNNNKPTDNSSINIRKILNGEYSIIKRYEEMTDEFLMSGIEIVGITGEKCFILNRNIVKIYEDTLKSNGKKITVIDYGDYLWKTYEPFDSVINKYRNSILKK